MQTTHWISAKDQMPRLFNRPPDNPDYYSSNLLVVWNGHYQTLGYCEVVCEGGYDPEKTYPIEWKSIPEHNPIGNVLAWLWIPNPDEIDLKGDSKPPPIKLEIGHAIWIGFKED